MNQNGGKRPRTKRIIENRDEDRWEKKQTPRTRERDERGRFQSTERKRHSDNGNTTSRPGRTGGVSRRATEDSRYPGNREGAYRERGRVARDSASPGRAVRFRDPGERERVTRNSEEERTTRRESLRGERDSTSRRESSRGERTSARGGSRDGRGYREEQRGTYRPRGRYPEERGEEGREERYASRTNRGEGSRGRGSRDERDSREEQRGTYKPGGRYPEVRREEEKKERYAGRGSREESRGRRKDDEVANRHGRSRGGETREPHKGSFGASRRENESFEAGSKPGKRVIRKEDPHARYSKKKQMEYRVRHGMEETELRLNRYIAKGGICSRRDADLLITAGRVKVNGEVVQQVGLKVNRHDKVEVDGVMVIPEKKIYILLNKPKDYVTTVEDPMERKTVMSLIEGACPERVYPIGRLDRQTTGVLLFTNDGDLAKKLTHPKYNQKKIYHVFLDRIIQPDDIDMIRTGITLEDGFVQADDVQIASDDQMQVGMEIHSGKNRIVRRIFEHLGYTILRLDRVYFAGITKKNLPRGKWRFLTQEEVNMLKFY